MKAGLVMVAAWLAAASTPLAAAELYQWKDARGRTVYSDQAPQPGAGDVQQRNFKGSVIEVGESYAAKVAREKHPVTLYTSACGAPCDQARRLLTERGVPHTTQDLESSTPARAELEKLTGRLNVPMLRVGDQNIEGFETGRWHAALDRAGYPRPTVPTGTPARGGNAPIP